MLSIKNVSKKFGSKNILDNVSLSVERGEIALLLGSSGVGKSTLLRMLNNLETMDSGSIELDGNQITREHHSVGMVFQQFNLFEHLNVLENITLALEKVLCMPRQQAYERAHTLLKQFGLEAKAHARVNHLSGGQKQRLAIARTLALQPVVVCMDEPTSALDPQLAGYVAKTIQDLAHQGYIVLVASHDTRLVAGLCASMYLMSNGTIIEQGTSEQLKEDGDRFPFINQFIKGRENH